jgi:hypothetical protein
MKNSIKAVLLVSGSVLLLGCVEDGTYYRQYGSNQGYSTTYTAPQPETTTVVYTNRRHHSRHYQQPAVPVTNGYTTTQVVNPAPAVNNTNNGYSTTQSPMGANTNGYTTTQ